MSRVPEQQPEIPIVPDGFPIEVVKRLTLQTSATEIVSVPPWTIGFIDDFEPEQYPAWRNLIGEAKHIIGLANFNSGKGVKFSDIRYMPELYVIGDLESMGGVRYWCGFPTELQIIPIKSNEWDQKVDELIAREHEYEHLYLETYPDSNVDEDPKRYAQFRNAIRLQESLFKSWNS